MLGDDLADFAYLWDRTEPGWVLWQLDGDDSHDLTRMSIFNRLTKMALVIEDDGLASEVVRQMQLHGVEVITEFPKD